MIPAPTCRGCGVDLYDETDIACTVCDTCTLCTPAAGNCFDCRDRRAEDSADLWQRAASDALREMHRGAS